MVAVVDGIVAAELLGADVGDDVGAASVVAVGLIFAWPYDADAAQSPDDGLAVDEDVDDVVAVGGGLVAVAGRRSCWAFGSVVEPPLSSPGNRQNEPVELVD